jgi:hypothetical protein
MFYEHHDEKLLPWPRFLSRVARHGGIALAVVLISLGIGTAGFHWLGPQEWLDAFLNAAMLLGGMGPVGSIDRPAGKVFASFYALYAGLIFLGASAVFLAPIVHRVLHRLRIQEERRR